MDGFQTAFQGEPETVIGTDNGRTTITVTARHLRPDDANIADLDGIVCALGAVGLAGWIGYETMEVSAPVIGLFCGGLFGRPLMQLQFRRWSQRTATIVFTEDSIAVQKAYRKLLEPAWHSFDRRHPHRFVLLPHDKAQAERDELEYQVRSTPARRVTRYYSDAFVVVLEYMGQRFDVAEVMGKRKATAILDRLSLCDQYMNGLAAAGQKIPLSPADEWAGTGGSVPR